MAVVQVGSDGGSGLFIAPPASTGTTMYGLQGSWFHFGFYMFIPTGYNMTLNLQDGVVKFILNCSPTQTAGKSDTHIGTIGFAMINEYDPNSNLITAIHQAEQEPTPTGPLILRSFSG